MHGRFSYQQSGQNWKTRGPRLTELTGNDLFNNSHFFRTLQREGRIWKQIPKIKTVVMNVNNLESSRIEFSELVVRAFRQDVRLLHFEFLCFFLMFAKSKLLWLLLFIIKTTHCHPREIACWQFYVGRNVKFRLIRTPPLRYSNMNSTTSSHLKFWKKTFENWIHSFLSIFSPWQISQGNIWTFADWISSRKAPLRSPATRKRSGPSP